jgi:hypothetical protein
MIYYSTGKSSYLKGLGAAVEETNLATAQILIKKGYIVESLDFLQDKKEDVVEKVQAVELPFVEKVVVSEKVVKKPVVRSKPKVKPRRK